MISTTTSRSAGVNDSRHASGRGRAPPPAGAPALLGDLVERVTRNDLANSGLIMRKAEPRGRVGRANVAGRRAGPRNGSSAAAPDRVARTRCAQTLIRATQVRHVSRTHSRRSSSVSNAALAEAGPGEPAALAVRVEQRVDDVASVAEHEDHLGPGKERHDEIGRVRSVDLLDHEQGQVGGTSSPACAGTLDDRVQADEGEPPRLRTPHVLELGRERIARRSAGEQPGQGRGIRARRRSVDAPPLVTARGARRSGTRPRASAGTGPVQVLGPREAQWLGALRLERIAEHLEEPGAAGPRGSPDPDQLRLELLVVEREAGGWRVALTRTSGLTSRSRADEPGPCP